MFIKEAWTLPGWEKELQTKAGFNFILFTCSPTGHQPSFKIQPI